MGIETLKIFNSDGLKAFHDFLNSTRDSEKKSKIKLPIDPNLLTNKNIIQIDSGCQIDTSKKFNDRYEMGHYLFKKLGDHANEYDNFGMWSWLSAIYFDQLSGKRTNSPEHFIPHEAILGNIVANASLHYRHSVRMPVYLVSNYEDEWCKFLLKDRLDTMGDPIEHCCSNKTNLKSSKLRQVILELYQDKTTLLPKSGAFSQINKNNFKSTAGKGGIRRFNGTLRDRLKKSYDIEQMDIKTIISKMGPEISSSKWVK